MICREAWTHTLKSGLYPRRHISKILWKPRVSQLYKERLGWRRETVYLLGEEAS